MLIHTDLINTIDKIEKSCGQEILFQQALQSLFGEKESVEMRIDLLIIIIRCHELLGKQNYQSDLKQLVICSVNLLLDKNKEIRIKAEELVEKIL